MELNQFRDVDVVIDKINDNFIQKQFVSQGDKNGRTFTVQVTDDGVIGEIQGLMLNLRWRNESSGLADLSAFSVVDKTNSIFKIEYPQHMMTPGRVIANIQVLHGGKVMHTKPFEITVQPLAGEMSGIIRQAEYSALVATLASANRFRTDIDTLDTKKADKSAVSILASGKVDKGGASQVTWEMLAQDARLQISGNKVAVVGDNSVTTSNLVNKAVTDKKTTFLDRNPNDTTSRDLYKTVTLSPAGEFYDVLTGKLINNDFTQVYKNTGAIAINPAATYKIKRINSVVFYDIKGTFISSWEYNKGETGDVYNFQRLPIPTNATTMIGNVNSHSWGNTATGTPELIENVEAIIFKELKIYEDNLSQSIKDSINAANNTRFRETTIVNFGDSIIENKNPSVSDFIATDLGATVVNGGFGGCMMALHPNQEYAKFSMTSIADAVATGDWSLQENATGVPEAFKNTIARLKAVDWANVYVATISYGTNDWLNSNPLDNPNDKYDKRTYLGALRYSIRRILQTYPHLKILVTAPIFRSTNDRTENSTNWKNGNGVSMTNYVDGLNQATKELFIPVADTYYGLGVNQWNEKHYYPANDGTHPNANGRKLLGQHIANAISQVY